MSIFHEDMDAGISRDQARLRAKIRALEGLQERRIALVAKQKQDLDATIEREQRRIENLKQQVTIGVAQ